MDRSWPASKPVAKQGIGTHQRERAEAKAEKDEIEHDASPVRAMVRLQGSACNALHQISIRVMGGKHKGNIKILKEHQSRRMSAREGTSCRCPLPKDFLKLAHYGIVRYTIQRGRC